MAKKKRTLKQGFAYTRKALHVPDSPEGFQWPANRGAAQATPEQRQRFAGALAQLIAARGLNHMTFAGEFLGEEMLPNGHLQRQGAGQVRKWLDAASFPGDMSARKI